MNHFRFHPHPFSLLCSNSIGLRGEKRMQSERSSSGEILYYLFILFHPICEDYRLTFQITKYFPSYFLLDIGPFDISRLGRTGESAVIIPGYGQSSSRYRSLPEGIRSMERRCELLKNNVFSVQHHIAWCQDRICNLYSVIYASFN